MRKLINMNFVRTERGASKVNERWVQADQIERRRAVKWHMNHVLELLGLELAYNARPFAIERGPPETPLTAPQEHPVGI